MKITDWIMGKDMDFEDTVRKRATTRGTAYPTAS